MSYQIYEEILEELAAVPAIDTHEHLRFNHMIDFDVLSERTVPFEIDLYKIIEGEYVGYILNSALPGTDAESRKNKKTIIDSLALINNTAGFRSGIEIPLKELYDFNIFELNENNWQELENKIIAKYKNGPWEWTKQVFEQANIQKALKINVAPDYYSSYLPSLSKENRQIEQEFFVGVGAVDLFIFHKPDAHEETPTQLSYLEMAEKYALSLDNIDGFVALIDKIIGEYKSAGACALKSAAGYRRTLKIENIGLDQANTIYRKPNDKLSEHEKQLFGDFAWIELAKAAAKYDLPFVIHTGPVPGSGHLLTECNPALMKGLLNNPELEDTKFVLIHTGYPFTRESVHIAWDRPNVWIDFVWMATLSIEASTQVLGEFLDWVPCNKFVMGGDYTLPEGAYGAMAQSREVLAMVLAKKVAWKIWSYSQAIEIGRRVLRQNAIELFNLNL